MVEARSAHPMLPHVGQGANQAIEDGVALAVLLEGCRSDDVADALKKQGHWKDEYGNPGATAGTAK